MINSIALGTRLKCIQDHPLIIGDIPVGTVVTVRQIGMARDWFCTVQWAQSWQGSKRTMRAVLKEADLGSFELVLKKDRRSATVQSDLPMSFHLKGLETNEPDQS